MSAYNVVVVFYAYEWYDNVACVDLGSVLAAMECDTDDDCLWICHPFVSIHILDLNCYLLLTTTHALIKDYYYVLLNHVESQKVKLK